MARHLGPGRPPRSRRGKSDEPETWQLGFEQLPFYVDSDPPVRPLAMLATDRDGLVLGFELYERAAGPADFAASIRRFMAEPMAGPPRSPARIITAEPDLALPLAAALEGIEVIEGDTGAADEAISSLSVAMAEEDETEPVEAHVATYLQRGIEPDAIARMFTAAAQVWRRAPWRVMMDFEVLGIDVPSLGIEKACLSVLGIEGQVLGFVLFESAAAFRQFRESAAAFDPEEEGELPGDLGPPMLSLTFDPVTEVPPGIPEEVKAHGWELADPSHLPVVLWVDGEGIPMPHRAREIALVTACADALAAMFAAHGGELESDEIPHHVVNVRSGELDVVITVPHPEVDWEEAATWGADEDPDEYGDEDEAEEDDGEPPS